MTDALFRVALADGRRLARGTIESGPAELLAVDLTLDSLLAAPGGRLRAALTEAPGQGPCPADAVVLAPIESQEVWCSGVTYERSRDARMEESTEPSIYDRVYDAARPELFFKAQGWRVRGPGETVGIRSDSEWDVPEPELGLVIAADLTICGYVIGNDMSSRTIEGDNPLYLPQAKVYEGACALGPAIVPVDATTSVQDVRLIILREGVAVFDGRTSTGRLKRGLDELAGWLGRALSFPSGVILLTGTGVVPDPPFTLRAGDVVRIEMGALGVLENPVVVVGG